MYLFDSVDRDNDKIALPVPFADFEAGRDRTDSHSRACVLMFLQPEKSDDTLT